MLINFCLDSTILIYPSKVIHHDAKEGEFNPSLLDSDRGLMGNASHLPGSNQTAVTHATLCLYRHIMDGFPLHGSLP